VPAASRLARTARKGFIIRAGLEVSASTRPATARLPRRGWPARIQTITVTAEMAGLNVLSRRTACGRNGGMPPTGAGPETIPARDRRPRRPARPGAAARPG